MYLSKLSIHGFKSFAEPTELRFDEGLTAIVGPNGCGKSNIVDAVRWVIGEQRARVLRSEKMENVIFNGTAKRRPLGMAEVKLTIENNRGVLPTEYNEVTLGRRLYRSGDSEYLLNDAQCRLKDITQLFMDTGMGADAYSVIELKMVDEILSDSAEDRRRLFEEAAGITKYKQRRRQALRKLENTQADLTRVRDLTDEVGKRVRRLKRQARKAASYNERKEQLDVLELQLAQAEYTRLHEQRAQLEAQRTETQDQIDAYTARLQREEARLEELRTAAVAREEAVSEKQTALADHKEAVSAIEADLRLADERLANANAEKDRLTEAQTDAEQRLSQLRERAAEVEEKIAKQTPVAEQAQEELAEARRLRDERQAAAADARARLSSLREKENTLRARQAEQQRALDRLENRIELKEETLAQLASSAEAAGTSLSALTTEAAQASDARDAASAKRKAAEEALQKAEQQQHERANILDEQRAALRQAERARDAAAHEVALLESLVSDYDEFSDAVQFLAGHEEWAANGLQTVADVLTCPPAQRAALDAALGGYASCIVVPTAAHVASARQLLRTGERGRATFLVMERLPDAPEAPEVPAEATALAHIVDVSDQTFAPIKQVLLNDCFLADSLDDATTLAERHRSQARFITPEGEWVDGRGVMYSGSVHGEASVATQRLERREQLAAARESLATAEEALLEAQTNVANAEEDLEAVPVQERRQALEAAREAHQKAVRSAEQAAYELRRAQEAQEAQKAQEAEAREALASLKDRRAPLNAELTTTTENLAEIEAARSTAADAYAAADAAERAAQEAFNATNVDAVRAQNTLDSLTQERTRTTEAIDELQTQAIARTDRLTTLNETITATNETRAALQEQLSERQQERGSLEDAVSEARTRLMEHKVEMNNVEKHLRQLRSSREEHVKQHNTHEVRLAEVNTRLEDLTEDIAESYNRSLADAPVSLPDDFDIQRARAEVRELRDSLDNMGSINALALEEYEEEQERLDFLTEQQDDLEQAEDTLLETITEINTTAEERFAATYEIIRENFQELFQELFGEAASADLILEDPDDPLESSIDIRAKPRGKRPVSLTQLSSGEKALTAVALLFSIYLVKPSPFCILDEVDAPLDDANVQRFMHLIERFSDKTQFILVTHNQQTMEHADRLYGITMQEAGVSKLVSVKFEEALQIAG